MTILAVDGGPVTSGWCVLSDGRVLDSCSEVANREMLVIIQNSAADVLACEWFSSFGMPVGAEVFDTCRWVGRFMQAWRDPEAVRLIRRIDVKMHLCHSARAKDGNIRQALLDKLGPVGTIKNKGPLYGVKSHAWAALAVAVTAEETNPCK